MNRIHESLNDLFQRHRLIFWYDAAAEWADDFESYEPAEAEKLRLADNEFGIKVRVLRDSPKDAKFLIYSATPRPVDAENWLLDLLLQGHEFKADRASLAVQELGIAYDYRDLAEEHVGFFRRAENVRRLRDLLQPQDEADDIRLKMMAVLCASSADIDALLLKFLGRASKEALLDPVPESFEASDLVRPFWRMVARLFGYRSQDPSLRDFAASLFREADPFDEGIELQPHARVFLQRWKDSQSHRESYEIWARRMERDLHIESKLEGVSNPGRLGEADAFEVFERFVIHRICQAFGEGKRSEDLRKWIADRRQSFWQEQHRHGYAALEQAIDLRDLLEAAELTMDSPEAGLQRYTGTWWRIDAAYRKFCHHQRKYGQVNVLQVVVDWVEGHYLNNFLLPLGDRWSDLVADMTSWDVKSTPRQRDFFQEVVKPVTERDQKLLVIVSDALRYEAAADFAARLNQENRWTAEIDPMLSALPSYTQLGMASLLPGSEFTLSPNDCSVLVDGRIASGLKGRKDILERAAHCKATALQAAQFLELNSKTEGRPLMREHDVVYVFHNVIDDTGDNKMTEAKTAEAVEQCFEELDAIVRKAASINWSTMVLTADHGFLFQQNPLHEGDSSTFPEANEWHAKDRRFAIGRGIKEGPGVKVFSASQLDLIGDWKVAFPFALGRFPKQGSGKRYVHGGFSLQETVLPIVRLRKARSDDTDRVEVVLLRVPSKITTGRLSVSLYQEKPVSPKVLSRKLKLGIFAKDGKLLSEQKTLAFDSASEEPRERERSHLLELSAEADAYNDQTVEIRLEETLPGTRQTVTYLSQPIKIQKPFASDFDEF